MTSSTVLKERGIRQALSNKAERLVEGHFIRDKYEGTVAFAFIPKRGHVTTFQMTRTQARELRDWLDSTETPG